MVRSILAVVVGLGATTTVIMLIQGFSSFIYPAPAGIENWDRERIAAYVKDMPAGAFGLLLLGYYAGTFCGTALTVGIARRAPLLHAAIICGAFMLGNLINLVFVVPSPLWYWAVSFATFPLAAAVGALIAWPRAQPLAV
jgi:hypothetical protein